MAVTATPTAGKRRAVYGLNVVLQAVIAVCILIFAIYIAQRFNRQVDLTRSGINSLSPGTRKLIQSLDQPIKITAMYGTSRKNDVVAETKIGQIRDLLALYDDAGGAEISTFILDPVEEQGRINEIIEQLPNKPGYRDEWQPHRAVVDKAKEQIPAVAVLVTTELQKLRELAQANPQLETTPGFADIRAYLGQVQKNAANLEEYLTQLETQVTTPYGEVAGNIRNFSVQAAEVLENVKSWMERSARSMPTGSIELKQWFTNAPQRLLESIENLKALNRESENLKPVRAEEVIAQLRSVTPILIDTDDEAVVVSSSDIWKYDQRDAEANAEPKENFEGEAAVSSAILRLTQKEKTGVIFVRYGGVGLLETDPLERQLALQQGIRELTPPLFEKLGRILRQRNFVPAEWDVKQSPTPPVLEGVVRTVYVVVPPPSPQPTRPGMPPTNTGMSPADVKVVTDAIEAGGNAIFLAGWRRPTVPQAGGLASYAYSSYLDEQWGISVEFDHFVVAFVENPQKDGVYLPITQDISFLRAPDSFRWVKHPITEPILSLPVGFVLVCPLRPAKVDDGEEPPAALQTLAQVTDDNVWGVANVMTTLQRDLTADMGTRPYPDSIRAPFDVVTIAEKKSGAADMRIIVVGAQDFISDSIADASLDMMTGWGQRIRVPINPGNVDFFVNALYWLTGDVDRIAVGPQSNDVPLLENLGDPETQKVLQIFLVGIWPAMALLFGGVVWFFRRR